MTPGLQNIHTHTSRCNHASGTVRDYVVAAREREMSFLGMSDHAPFPDGRWPEPRMQMKELIAYEDEVYRAREEFPDLPIALGLESEYVSENRAFLEDEILGERGYDYLVGGVHYVRVNGSWKDFHKMTSPQDLVAYSTAAVKTMESGLFAFLAHPDLFGYAYPEWDINAEACARDILSAAESLQIPLEINGYGMRKSKIMTRTGERWRYPWLAFWDMAAGFDIRILANSDAHEPENVAGNIEDCLALAEDRGLRPIKPSQLLSHNMFTNKKT